MNKDLVVIMMSTYNGEHYLEEQLNSILNQTYKNIVLMIRDDGSTDKTIDILKKYEKEYENVKVILGKNLGPAKSFWTLLKRNDFKSGYYAFSDQDDVWDNDKIEKAIELIKDNDKPTLYFSDTRLVDKNLNTLKNIRKIDMMKINIGNAFIENIATGCTCVFNNLLKEELELIDVEEFKNSFMHDSMAYRVCYAIGEVKYDNIPHISYRQHNNNVIGNSSNFIDKFKKRKKQISKSIRLRSSMAKFILEKYDLKIEKYNKEIIKKIACYNNSFKDKLKLLFEYKKIKRMNIIDDLLYRIGIVFNKV